MLVLEDDLIKVLFAIAVGGVIGLERELRDKDAGFRTLIFICLGSTLFTLFSIKLGGPTDATRIAANIVSGVGFLGAGVIPRERGRVVGLTTAATIWLVAALGMGAAGGYYGVVSVVTGISLVVLWGFSLVEHWISRIREERTYEVVLGLGTDKSRALQKVLEESELRIARQRQCKAGSRLIFSWEATGSPRAHERLSQKLLAAPEVEEFRF